jgi:hypothetical protein
MNRRMNLLLTPILLLAGLNIAGSQTPSIPLNEQTLEHASSLGVSLVSWVRAEVLPEAMKWKATLDQGMTAGDLQQLEALRSRAATNRSRTSAVAARVADAARTGDNEAASKARQEMLQLVAERKALAVEVGPLAKRYAGLLRQIGGQARPKAATWGQQARQIAERWWSEHRGEIHPAIAAAVDEFVARKGNLLRLIPPGMKARGLATSFMLWNGNDPTVEIQDAIERKDFLRLRLTPELY